MRRRIYYWLIVVAGVVVLGLLVVLDSKPCYACSTVTVPPPCTTNLSALTVKQGDTRKVWWNFLDSRDPYTLNLYMGLNNNSGVGTANYDYRVSGQWDSGQSVVVTPTLISGVLDTAGSRDANRSHQLTVTYAPTQTGTFNLMATRLDGGGACILPESASTQVRVNPSGPTLWPITPRTCPMAGQKQNLTFGLRNPNEQPQTYAVTAIAENPFDVEKMSLNDQGGAADLGQMTLAPGETREIKITCETFGYCLTGSENKVRIKAVPIGGSAPPVEALASANVTLRDPNAFCPDLSDWWFVMSPLVLAALIGTPTLLGAGLAGGIIASRRGPKPQVASRPEGRRMPEPGKDLKKTDTAPNPNDILLDRPKKPPSRQ
jgi:hypothetical protein